MTLLVSFHWPRFLSSSTRSNRFKTLRFAVMVLAPLRLRCCDINFAPAIVRKMSRQGSWPRGFFKWITVPDHGALRRRWLSGSRRASQGYCRSWRPRLRYCPVPNQRAEVPTLWVAPRLTTIAEEDGG